MKGEKRNDKPLFKCQKFNKKTKKIYKKTFLLGRPLINNNIEISIILKFCKNILNKTGTWREI